MKKSPSSLRARSQFKDQILHGDPPKPFQVSCGHCGKQVSSAMYWRCGNCEHVNHRTELYSFLYKCQNCGVEPDSFACPHCHKAVLLALGGEKGFAATLVSSLPKVRQTRDRNAETLETHGSRKADLSRQIEIAELKAKLAELRGGQKSEKESSPQEKIARDLERHLEHAIGEFVVVSELKRKMAERYKDDPDLRERAKEVLDKWLEDRS